MQGLVLPKIWFLLLINTKSGGGWGKRYLQLKKQQFHFEYKKQYNVYVKLIDLFDHTRKAQQLSKAKQLQMDPINDVRVIICGGDGTIIWGVEECHKAGLNFEKLLIACLPIGTGNDFSRTIGWGSSPLHFQQGKIFELKKRIIEWINSSVSKYDVWQVEISVYEKGQIYTVKNGEDFLTEKKVYKTGFVNYVGIGIDARVSYNFEKNRKSTKMMNFAVYTCLACLFCCKSIPELSDAVQTFEQSDVQQQDTIEAPMTLKQCNLQDSMIERINDSEYQRCSKKISFKKGYHGLICLNSISYMAGVLNSWETSKIGCSQKKVKFKKQEINDGNVQFLGYKNQLILGMQKVLHTGARIAQGQGPFAVKFKQDSLESQNYVQIDGEGLMIKGIKQVVIKRNQSIPTINVMVRKNDK